MATKLPKERESKIQRSIIVRLRRLGIILHRRNVGAMQAGERFIRFASPGQSDLWGWIAKTGVHVEIEVKAKGNRPTPKQLEWLKECSRLGCVAFWGDNCNTVEYVAEAIMKGGRIAWHEDDSYDVEMPA